MARSPLNTPIRNRTTRNTTPSSSHSLSTSTSNGSARGSNPAHMRSNPSTASPGRITGSVSAVCAAQREEGRFKQLPRKPHKSMRNTILFIRLEQATTNRGIINGSPTKIDHRSEESTAKRRKPAPPGVRPYSSNHRRPEPPRLKTIDNRPAPFRIVHPFAIRTETNNRPATTAL